MALAIRMARGGRTNLPFYRIVVADKRYPRDGRYLEKLGTYDPRLPSDHERRLVLNTERIQYWLGQGAQPSDRVARFLGKAGLVELKKWDESPKKSAPKAKSVERQREKDEKAKAAQEAAEEAARQPAEEQPAAAPAEDATPSSEAPAEGSPAE